MENPYHLNEYEKGTRVVTFLSYKTDFKTNTITRDKGHYIGIKRTIKQEDIYGKYLCTQQGSTQLHRTLNNKYEVTNH